MKRLWLLSLVLILGLLACSVPGTLAEETEQPQEANPQSQRICGDQICDGPENSQNCPEDCPGVGLAARDEIENSGEDENTPEPEPTPTNDEDVSENGYRYISFGGTIQTEPNTASMGDFTGVAFGYVGEYKIELWFPMSGGEAVQQRNTIALTQLNDLYYDADPCVWELNANAYEAISFELNASLTLDTYIEGGEPADDLRYQLTAIPQKIISGIVTCQGSPDEFSDPSAYPVLTSWFSIEHSNPVKLYVIESNSIERETVSPIYWINIPEETLSYVIVPDLDTP